MNLETIHTARLTGRMLKREDLEDISTVLQDPLVSKTLTITGTPIPTEIIQSRLLANEEQWKEYGYGLWGFRKKRGKQYIGQGGFRVQKLDGITEVDFGYAIASKHWNQGYASEIAQTCIELATTTLKLKTLVAITLPINVISQHILQKCGLVLEREINYHGTPHYLFRIRWK